MTSITLGRGPRTALGFRGWDRFDYMLTFAALALVVYGLVLIHTASRGAYDGTPMSFSNPVVRQGLFALIGLGGMLVVSQIDYHRLVHFAWVFYALGILSLILILAVGSDEFGSRRWFTVGPIQIQPSEFAKLATILAMARFMSERGGHARELKTLLITLAMVAPVAALVFIEPDLGTSIVFLAIWLGVVVVSGVQRSHLLVIAAIGLAILPFAWTFAIEDYQVSRVAVLVDPTEDPLGEGYNVLQSQIAVGSGQLTGKGLGNGEQTQLRFLAVPTRDFIFSVLGEELGFVGAMGLFALFAVVLMRGIRAAQFAGDSSGQIIAVGIVVFIMAQTFINIAVNLSLFPVTGLPLPFVSQGGSSLVTLFASLGLLQSIVIRHRAYRQA